MPRLEDGEQVKKTFKKIAYRPWNIFFNESIDENNQKISKQLDNNNITISKQLDNNNITISKQLDNAHSPNKETISKPISKHKTSLISKQLVNKNYENTSVLDAVKNLYGLQKKIFFYIVDDCVSRGILTSSRITNETLRSVVNTDANSIKTTIHRLIKKSILSRITGKRGKGGFTVFSVTESVRNAVIEEKRKDKSQLVNN